MSDVAIKVENLGKLYRLGEVGTGTISHDINRWWAKLRGKEDPFAKVGEANDRTKKGDSDYVWAVRDISFEVKKGEVLGIIGRNGAGKSTLLKLLSKVTQPTEGRIKVQGRIASLLEVGTGFHPEMTGRENIFQNGAILGMTRAEIRSKFDEIVDFAGVERYIDTPVKRYSSGMYVRLAFAVAAFLEPEILIVDEVLAVGDAEFQKKCLGRMQDVSKNDGRTVLFVSHQMAAIAQLCNRCILLQNGALSQAGITSDVIDYYLDQYKAKAEKIYRNNTVEGNHFQLIAMTNESMDAKVEFRFDEEIYIQVRMAIRDYFSSLELAMRLIDRNKRAVFTIHERIERFIDDKDSLELLIKIPSRFLVPNNYSWVICINHPGVGISDLHEDVLPFAVLETGSDFARYEGLEFGNVFAQYEVNKV